MIRQNLDEHLDPTAEISLETVKSRTVKGVLTLTGRTFILNIISLVAQGFLWAFLEPKDFGIFFIVSATVNFFSYFADIGLGAALIQKKEKPTDVDFKTVFTTQEILVLAITTIVFLISPVLAKTNSLSHEGVWLLYALNISFFMASLKNIPSIILERKLEFGKFVIPQVLEQVVYNISVVFFAWKGFGITSFTYSVLVRGVVGVVAIYFLQPWKPSIGISKDSLKSLLKFGIPYQLNNFLATVKDDGITIVLGGILGSANLGIFGTAQKLVQYPLRFFMDNVTKVTFPAFSRMQDDRKHLENALSRSIFFICVLVFPSLIGLIVVFPDLVNFIPKYQKWAPAYIPLIFLSINSLLAAASTQLTNLLNSIGKIKTTFKLMIMWTVLTWLLVPFLGKQFGINGASVAYALVGTSSVVVFYQVKKFLNWSIIGSVGIPLISSLIMGFILFIINLFIHNNGVISLFVTVVIGILIYFSSLYLLVGSSLILDAKKVFTGIFKK